MFLRRCLASIQGNQWSRLQIISQKHSYFNHGALTASFSSEASNQQSSSSTQQPVIINDNCIKRLKELAASNKHLRLLVDSGGCSGFEYRFSVESQIGEDDRVIEKEGCKVLIDNESLKFIEGATIDFYEELIRTGFRVLNNPKSEQGCSCGTSFAPKI